MKRAIKSAPSHAGYTTEAEHSQSMRDYAAGRRNSVRAKKKRAWMDGGGKESETEGKSSKELDEMLSKRGT